MKNEDSRKTPVLTLDPRVSKEVVIFSSLTHRGVTRILYEQLLLSEKVLRHRKMSILAFLEV